MFDFSVIFSGQYEVYIEFFTIFLLASCIHVAAGWIFKGAIAQANKTKGIWLGVVVHSMAKPIYLLIWAIAMSFFIQLLDRTDSQLLSMISTQGIRTIAFASVIAWFALRFVKESEARLTSASYSKHSKLDKTTAQAVSKLLNALVIIGTVLIVLPSFGVNIAHFVTFGAASTFVLGIAAQDMIKNFFGGFMIYFERPFKVGDWINSPDKNIEGTVEYIGWRLTRIRTFDKRPMYVPNSVFNSISVVNPSRMSNRRIKKIIGIRYDDAKKIPVILSDIKRMLTEHPGIDTKVTCFINVEDFGPSSIDCRLYVFSKTTVWTEFMQVQQDVLLRCNEIITGHGAEVAFPTTTLHVPETVPVELLEAKQE